MAIAFFLGSIPFGSNTMVGPTGENFNMRNTFAEYSVTRGKPVLHEIGEELDTQSLDFFFSEEFCSPASELAKLKAAFALKTPLPLVFGNGVYLNKRYVVDSLSGQILQRDTSGGIVRVEASMGLRESPVSGLLGLISSIARGRAPAIRSRASSNPNARRG